MSGSIKRKDIKKLNENNKKAIGENKQEENKIASNSTQEGVYCHQDFVNVDNIRKQVNQKEWDLMKKWPTNYGFLSGEFLKKKLAEESQAQNINPKHLNKQEDFPIVEPTDLSPVPVTSSAFVGWRCSDNLNVEFIDTKYQSPKHTIEPPLQVGEFRIKHQHFIYLG